MTFSRILSLNQCREKIYFRYRINKFCFFRYISYANFQRNLCPVAINSQYSNTGVFVNFKQSLKTMVRA